MWVLQTCCGACRSQSLLAVFIDENKDCPTMSPVKFCDLALSEIDKFDDVRITADDVLDMHDFLGEVNSSFFRLLG
jgi:hypothetical protein